MMPGKSYLSLIKDIKKTNHTPVILTAKGETVDRIKAVQKFELTTILVKPLNQKNFYYE